MMYMPVQSIFAAMVKTETVLADGEILIAREKVRAFLDRKDVQAALTARGINPLEAKARVSSLSDAEVKIISAKIDQLPAGGDALGFLIVFVAVCLRCSFLFSIAHHGHARIYGHFYIY
jgi:hypothetical protein